MIEVITCGEMLIDMMAEDNNNFKAHPGGAPANVAINTVRLGHKSMFIGKRGNDPFGEILCEYLDHEGVNVSNFSITKDAPTAVAFVFRKSGADPHFIFYGDPSAHDLLSVEDITSSIFEDARWFHFGSISLYHEVSRAATHEALRCAREAGLIISYDPNLRQHLLEEREGALNFAREVVEHVDVIKVSEEEVRLITHEKTEEKAIKKLIDSNVKLIAVTRGAEGSSIYTQFEKVDTKPPNVKPIDTTGAGDAFTASLISRLLEEGVKSSDQLATLDQNSLLSILEFASMVSAKSTESMGATMGVVRPGE